MLLLLFVVVVFLLLLFVSLVLRLIIRALNSDSGLFVCQCKAKIWFFCMLQAFHLKWMIYHFILLVVVCYSLNVCVCVFFLLLTTYSHFNSLVELMVCTNWRRFHTCFIYFLSFYCYLAGLVAVLISLQYVINDVFSKKNMSISNKCGGQTN